MKGGPPIPHKNYYDRENPKSNGKKAKYTKKYTSILRVM